MVQLLILNIHKETMQSTLVTQFDETTSTSGGLEPMRRDDITLVKCNDYNVMT